MKNRVPVSVVMPVYNGAAHIRECLDSILRQTFHDFEVLIVEDGSTDDTCDIINSFGDQRIRLTQNHHDYIASSNLLLTRAKGKYIARMDSNDIMMPDRLRLQFEYMEAHPDMDAVGGCIEYFGAYHGFTSLHWETFRFMTSWTVAVWWITSFRTKPKINHYEQPQEFGGLVGQTRLRSLGGDKRGNAQRRVCCLGGKSRK